MSRNKFNNLLMCCFSIALTYGFKLSDDRHVTVNNHYESQNKELKSKISHLLSETIPVHYNLHLRTQIHEGSSTFEGNSVITIKALQATNNIVLNSKELIIKSVKISMKDESDFLKIAKFEIFDNSDIMLIYLENELIGDSIYYLHLEWNGVLRTLDVKNVGFYRFIVEKNQNV